MDKQINKILEKEEFREKYRNLSRTNILDFPEAVALFVEDTIEDSHKSGSPLDVDRMLLYNHIYCSYLHIVAIKHFNDLDIHPNLTHKRISRILDNISDDWICNYEDAMIVIKEFMRICELLSL